MSNVEMAFWALLISAMSIYFIVISVSAFRTTHKLMKVMKEIKCRLRSKNL